MKPTFTSITSIKSSKKFLTDHLPPMHLSLALTMVILIVALLATPLTAFAEEPSFQTPGFEGGVQDPRIYREMIFITGQPVLLEGELTISDRGGRVTYNYRNLSSADGEITMTRNVTMEKTLRENGGDQKTETYELTRFRETINANDNTYQSDERDNQWSKSSVYHAKPAATYFAGNWDGRKYYHINGDEGRVIVETRGNRVGYDQQWSSIDTQTLIHYIDYEHTNGEEEPLRWQGTAQVQAAHNRTVSPHYQDNAPTQISFRGAYRLTEQEENVLKVSYDLPRFSADGIPNRQRNLGTDSFTLDSNPTNEMLSIPQMRDTNGHGAEEPIRFLASLNAFPAQVETFGPDLPISRAEFARALTVATGHAEQKHEPERRPSFQRATREETLFADVGEEHPYRPYIESAYHNNLMAGVDQNRFDPDGTITRAEAVTILIKALGFQHLAPIQQYGTGYLDDAQIPLWARDAAYLAGELGLITDQSGYFQPQRQLTKADTAILLNDFIDYLRQDLRYDYRERILNF
ncbi:S-layer homology domain-containing protein [Tindallia californiensis]|uniref:S-layer homology domain-containing protein n=1 Tax=Tindallia californiensis TaxID=159292 RepID=A0A1H3PET8_9FIRM|nr:S-layer homology domain-containing protein [Tindallia californiensis]SDY99682.1 S-layer homology domain-containing protein [Tindallia californiensis]